MDNNLIIFKVEMIPYYLVIINFVNENINVNVNVSGSMISTPPLS